MALPRTPTISAGARARKLGAGTYNCTARPGVWERRELAAVPDRIDRNSRPARGAVLAVLEVIEIMAA